MTKTQQLKGKLAAIKVKLNLEEVRNERLTLALEYYAKRGSHLGWLKPGWWVAREALD